MAQRVEKVSIECADALQVIHRFDSIESLFYVDPPYFNAHMGHYGGYTENDFKGLLNTLSQIKGKFLLSSYPSDILNNYIQANQWHTLLLEKNLCMSKGKKKVEVLTANYIISK